MLSGKFLTSPMSIQLSIPKKEKIQTVGYLSQNAIITAFHTRVAGATICFKAWEPRSSFPENWDFQVSSCWYGVALQCFKPKAVFIVICKSWVKIIPCLKTRKVPSPSTYLSPGLKRLNILQRSRLYSRLKCRGEKIEIIINQ